MKQSVGEHLSTRENFLFYFQNCNVCKKSIFNIPTFSSQCWKECEMRAGGQYPEPGSERDRVFSVRINDIQERARALIKHRRKTVQENPTTPTKFIDIVMDFGGDDESLIESDVVDYILAAYMSTGDRKFSYLVFFWTL